MGDVGRGCGRRCRSGPFPRRTTYTIIIYNYKIYIIIIIMQGVRPAVPFRSLSKADDVAAGFLEGVMDLPVDGRWLVP